MAREGAGAVRAKVRITKVSSLRSPSRVIFGVLLWSLIYWLWKSEAPFLTSVLLAICLVALSLANLFVGFDKQPPQWVESMSFMYLPPMTGFVVLFVSAALASVFVAVAGWNADAGIFISSVLLLPMNYWGDQIIDFLLRLLVGKNFASQYDRRKTGRVSLAIRRWVYIASLVLLLLSQLSELVGEQSIIGFEVGGKAILLALLFFLAFDAYVSAYHKNWVAE